jgi:hypothetical protein
MAWFGKKLRELAFSPPFTLAAGTASIVALLGWLYDKFASPEASPSGNLIYIVVGGAAIALVAILTFHSFRVRQQNESLKSVIKQITTIEMY